MKTFISAKIHGIKITDKALGYNGSVTICPDLLKASGIEPYEQVQVINVNNGERFITYAIKAEKKGYFSLNGGCARLGELGDKCLVLTYKQEENFSGANVVFCTEDNGIKEETRYKKPE